MHYGIRHQGTPAIRSRLQALPARCTCRGQGVPSPVHRGQMSIVRGAAPVPAFRGIPGPAEPSGCEAGKGWGAPLTGGTATVEFRGR
jgi:hypothetical protein